LDDAILGQPGTSLSGLGLSGLLQPCFFFSSTKFYTENFARSKITEPFRKQKYRFMPIKKTILLFAILPMLFACKTAKSIKGYWKNKDQGFVFYKDGKADWLFYKTTQTDTFRINYRVDYQTKQLDLSGFESGFLKGKTLFGIFDLKKDTLVFDCEPSINDPSVRPAAFNPKQTQYYIKTSQKQ
jgi:hypothetical protein